MENQQTDKAVRRPAAAKITDRSSTITNVFIQAIIPKRTSSNAEIDKALAILGQKKPSLTCVYCGVRASDWDHLRPLVRNKKPTGYIHEVRNYVPACGVCNQSKGGSDWEKWMLGSAKNSPARRNIDGIEARACRLRAFVEWGQVQPISIPELCNGKKLEDYWSVLEKLQADLKAAQALAAEIGREVQKRLDQGTVMSRT